MVAMIPGGHPHRKEAKHEHLEYDNRPTLLGGYHGDRPSYQAKFREALFNDDGTEIYPFHSPACDASRSRWFENFFCEDYKGVKLRIWRQRYELIGDTAKAVNQGSIAQRVEKLIDTGMEADSFRKQPPSDLVNYQMAKTLIQHQTKRPSSQLAKLVEDPVKTRDEVKKRNTNLSHIHQSVKAHFTDAVNYLWRKPERWNTLRAEYDEASVEEKRVMSAVIETVPLPKQTANERRDRDEVASRDSSILASIPDDVVFIATDKNNMAMYIHWPQAVQILFGGRGEEVLEKLRTDIETYSYLEPPDEPDPHRHPLDSHWIEKNPTFDKNRLSQKESKKDDKNVHGVYHFGFGGYTGKGKTDIQIKRDSCRKSADTRRVLTEIEQGSLACIAEAHRFVQEILDPGLVRRQVAAMKKFPYCGTFRIPDESYSVCAVLNCVKTDSHQDSSDVARGLAMLSPLGQFHGGDFCIQGLGIKHAFRTGAISAIRGHELSHYTDSWVGRERYCIVDAFHEMVLQRAEEMPPGHVLARDGKTTEATGVIVEETCATVKDTLKVSNDDLACDSTSISGSAGHYSDRPMGQSQRGHAIENLDSEHSSPRNQEGLDEKHPICLDSDGEPEMGHDIGGQQPALDDHATRRSDQVKRSKKRRRLA